MTGEIDFILGCPWKYCNLIQTEYVGDNLYYAKNECILFGPAYVIFITDLINIEKIDKRISNQEIYTTLKQLWKPRVLPEKVWKPLAHKAYFSVGRNLPVHMKEAGSVGAFLNCSSSEPENTDSDLSDSLVMCSMCLSSLGLNSFSDKGWEREESVRL